MWFGPERKEKTDRATSSTFLSRPCALWPRGLSQCCIWPALRSGVFATPVVTVSSRCVVIARLYPASLRRSASSPEPNRPLSCMALPVTPTPLSVCLSVCLSVLSVCLSFCLSVCLSVCLCPSVRPFVREFVSYRVRVFQVFMCSSVHVFMCSSFHVFMCSCTLAMLRFAPVRFASVRVLCCVELELELAGFCWFLLFFLRCGSTEWFLGSAAWFLLGGEGGVLGAGVRRVRRRRRRRRAEEEGGEGVCVCVWGFCGRAGGRADGRGGAVCCAVCCAVVLCRLCSVGVFSWGEFSQGCSAFFFLRVFAAGFCCGVSQVRVCRPHDRHKALGGMHSIQKSASSGSEKE